MIRIFNVYYPVRFLVLVFGETLMVVSSLLLGTMLQYREDSFLVLNFEHGYQKIFALTVITVLLSHWFDLYDTAYVSHTNELQFRLLLVPGILALMIAAAGAVYPAVLVGNHSFVLGLAILTFTLLVWRSAYSWLSRLSCLRERVYILGSGERAQRLMQGLRDNLGLGVDVVGWTGDLVTPASRESTASHLLAIARQKTVHRVIVAMQNRRDMMPMPELLQLRLQSGIHIEEATTWLEKISGKIEVEQLYPSWIIFARGFRFTALFRFIQRILNFLVGTLGLAFALPLIPFIMLAVRLDSPGPVLYRQKRVGRGGRTFYCYKFRTMHQDAEADVGATWASDDDPRITRVGNFLRMTRLDEIPQLWCVIRGDMAFVGPRPERPEFVEWLSKEIPYYGIRHLVRPGITGWAQVRYKYGNTVEDAKEKLQFDLFYIKNASIGLDILIMFQTLKIVLLRRGAQ